MGKASEILPFVYTVMWIERSIPGTDLEKNPHIFSLSLSACKDSIFIFHKVSCYNPCLALPSGTAIHLSLSSLAGSLAQLGT